MPGIKSAEGKRKIWHKGASNHASVLSDEDAETIKASPKIYRSGAALARHFKVTETVITGIRLGKRWAHVKVSEAGKARAASLFRALKLGELGD